MRPDFVGVAGRIGACHRDETSGVRVAQEQLDVEDDARDLLHHAGDFEIGAELPRQFRVASAAGLQIALMRRSIDG